MPREIRRLLYPGQEHRLDLAVPQRLGAQRGLGVKRGGASRISEVMGMGGDEFRVWKVSGSYRSCLGRWICGQPIKPEIQQRETVRNL